MRAICVQEGRVGKKAKKLRAYCINGPLCELRGDAKIVDSRLTNSACGAVESPQDLQEFDIC